MHGLGKTQLIHPSIIVLVSFGSAINKKPNGAIQSRPAPRTADTIITDTAAGSVGGCPEIRRTRPDRGRLTLIAWPL